MSEIERHKRTKNELAPRHIPQEVVPVPIAEVREFVRDAVSSTSFGNPFSRAISGWAFFEPLVRFTSVDAVNTRVELDVAGPAGVTGALFSMQRRAMIHRFFVALDDELDRREKWRPNLPVPRTPIESGESGD